MRTADGFPPWAVMWLLAVAIFASLKWLTWCARPKRRVPAWRHYGYLFGWPGLDAAGFLHGGESPAPTWNEWLFATAKTLLGAIVIWMLWPRLAGGGKLLQGWVGMIGVALILHFGLFHLLSCLWRHIGISARPLMDSPLCATSVSEFWGRRWNTAFRDVTHRFFFRPLAKRVAPSAALLLGFLVSGLIHELAISVPANGGYGGPTLYFLIQAAGIGIERVGQAAGLPKPWQASGLPHVAGRLFTLLIVAAPALILFHPPFVRAIVVPFLEVITGRPTS